MEVKINTVELATNLATEKLKAFIQNQRENAGVEPLSEEDLDKKIYKKNEDGEIVFKQKYQEIFNDFYDDFETGILKCEIND